MFVLLRELNRLRRAAALPESETRGSLAVRHVDAGSCNGCEHELGAVSGLNYDLSRFGLTITASPRHADLLLVTGPVTVRMLEPLRTAYAAMPEPRMVAALGNCALGIDLIGDPEEYVGSVTDVLPVDVCVPGCPPAPDVIVRHLLEAMKQRS